jgi:transposase-like protein
MAPPFLTDWQKLETVCLTGSCPSCGSDENLTAIEYESDREVWFECESCKWNQTFDLLDAKEAGYYCSYGREDITDE